MRRTAGSTCCWDVVSHAHPVFGDGDCLVKSMDRRSLISWSRDLSSWSACSANLDSSSVTTSWSLAAVILDRAFRRWPLSLSIRLLRIMFIFGVIVYAIERDSPSDSNRNGNTQLNSRSASSSLLFITRQLNALCVSYNCSIKRCSNFNVKGRLLVRRFVNNCFQCRLLRSKPCPPFMTPLPRKRLEKSSSLFDDWNGLSWPL